MPIHKIFLYSSIQTLSGDVYVYLKLAIGWTLLANYPASICAKQEARWHVTTSAAGDIQELERCGSKVPYLFYETEIKCSLPSPVNGHYTSADLYYGQGMCTMNGKGACQKQMSISNGTEMIRNRAEFVEYIENVMTNVFHFDQKQAIDMITPMLGRITYPQVIFRFLSKSEVQSAAQLMIQPPPGLVIRAFLLYGCASKLTAQGGDSKGGTKTTAATTTTTTTTTLAMACGAALKNESQTAQPRLGSTDALNASLRATDWAKVVIGTDAAMVDNEFRDPAVFKVLEYATYEVA